MDTKFLYTKDVKFVPRELIHNKFLEKIGNFLEKYSFSFEEEKTFNINIIPNDEIIDRLSKLGEVISFSSERYVILSNEYCVYSIVQVFSRFPTRTIILESYSKDRSNIKIFHNEVEKCFINDLKNTTSCSIKWWYTENGESTYEVIPEILDDVIHKEAYPYIENLDNFIKEYIFGKEQILLLMGKPGTGKTRLIRYILQTIGKNLNEMKLTKSAEDLMSSSRFFEPDELSDVNVIYTTDSKVLEGDSMFINFLQGDYSAMVLEDIDFNLKSRKEGNTNMYKLLASSDGLLQNSNKKIIISTNIQTTKDIDEALIRPGRCFALINAKELTVTEGKTLMKKIGGDPSIIKNKQTVAEIYKMAINNDFNSIKTRKIGFDL